MFGPTASGKTSLAVELAKAIDAEVLSVDSALVYRHMDIGTAKPTITEKQSIPHHLIDICEPDDPYSVARFSRDACTAIEDISQRGRSVVLAGGTMMYFHALTNGLAPLPNADIAIREQLTQEAAVLGWQALHDRLAYVDPVSAQRIHPNDPQRLQRALEVFMLSGKPLSELQKQTQSPLPMQPIKFALVPEDRAWLHRRIEKRLETMFADGLIDEVKQLKHNNILHAELPSMRCVGYRQVWQMLEGVYNEASCVDKVLVATRQLAKRQLTWIRSADNYTTVTADKLDTQAQLQRILKTLRVGNG
ncbi:MAG: tRNA (adenosine(37)-N6)-dimethylallyltransferase MiaA [Granulosicoccaceae bacterium]